MTSMLADFKVSSLACKCVYYRPEHNAKGRPHSIECAVLEMWSRWSICLLVMFNFPSYVFFLNVKNGSFFVFSADNSKN